MHHTANSLNWYKNHVNRQQKIKQQHYTAMAMLRLEYTWTFTLRGNLEGNSIAASQPRWSRCDWSIHRALLSLVFMFGRHTLLLAIDHFHPLLLVCGTTSLPWSEALPPLPLSKSLSNVIFFPVSWFTFLLLLPFFFFLLSFLFL